MVFPLFFMDAGVFMLMNVPCPPWAFLIRWFGYFLKTLQCWGTEEISSARKMTPETADMGKEMHTKYTFSPTHAEKHHQLLFQKQN